MGLFSAILAGGSGNFIYNWQVLALICKIQYMPIYII